ncbi:MAG TPA: acyl-CoA dehydrogenase family protein [Candidatus Nanoarchaeia archaeon]|nr:acyl-CoA dehydrogenase family protein [Candidatus Nanoarchaeia archaeon]
MKLEYTGFSEDDKLFSEQIRKFVKNEELLKEAVASDAEQRELDARVVDAAKEAGYFGILVPEEFGGVGGTNTQYCIVAEEISRACFALSNMIAVHSGLCTSPIIRFGSEELKERYLPKLATGEFIGAIAMTEPNAGSNIAATETTACLDDKVSSGISAAEAGDHFILNGTKRFITNAKNAQVFFTVAYSGDRSKGPYGNMSAFVVEAGYPGVSIGNDTGKKMGLNAVPNSEVLFENVRVPKSNVLGAVGDGYKIQHATMESGRIFLAACSLGIAREVFERAVEYSKERVFPLPGKPVPACDFQINQERISNMAELVYAMATTVYNTTKLMDAGENTKGQGSLTKSLCTDMAWKVVDEAMEMFGGMAYVRETGIERFMRELWIAKIYEGTNDICRIIAAKELLKAPRGY